MGYQVMCQQYQENATSDICLTWVFAALVTLVTLVHVAWLKALQGI